VGEQEPVEALKEAANIVAVERLKDAFAKLKAEMSKVIVGQHRVLEELLIAMFARGHCLLIGVPGLAKTLMIHTMADALNLMYSRIRVTHDLMRSEVTGTKVMQVDKLNGVRQIKFWSEMAIFASIVLAYEISDTPPQTQAPLLEAMKERQVTVGRVRHKLPGPFFVLATQNPIEQEGTYPLPEAQLDRFMLNILVGYPSEEEEFDIVRMTTSVLRPLVSKVLSGTDILGLQELVPKVPIADHISRYAVRLTRATGRDERKNFADLIPWARFRRTYGVAIALRGYNVSNVGRSPEFLDHPVYSPIVRSSTLTAASVLCSAAAGEKVGLVTRMQAQEPSDLSTFVHEFGNRRRHADGAVADPDSRRNLRDPGASGTALVRVQHRRALRAGAPRRVHDGTASAHTPFPSISHNSCLTRKLAANAVLLRAPFLNELHYGGLVACGGCPLIETETRGCRMDTRLTESEKETFVEAALKIGGKSEQEASTTGTMDRADDQVDALFATRYQTANSPVHRAVWNRKLPDKIFLPEQPKLPPACQRTMQKSIGAVTRPRAQRTLYGHDNKTSQAVLDGLSAAGYWGLLIDPQYGGVAAQFAAFSWCLMQMATIEPNVAWLASVHGCIGAIDPLRTFGSAEQKERYLPRLASRAKLPGFAMNEPCAGSDVTGSASCNEWDNRVILADWSDRPERLWDVMENATTRGSRTVNDLDRSRREDFNSWYRDCRCGSKDKKCPMRWRGRELRARFEAARSFLICVTRVTPILNALIHNFWSPNFVAVRFAAEPRVGQLRLPSECAAKAPSARGIALTTVSAAVALIDVEFSSELLKPEVQNVSASASGAVIRQCPDAAMFFIALKSQSAWMFAAAPFFAPHHLLHITQDAVNRFRQISLSRGQFKLVDDARPSLTVRVGIATKTDGTASALSPRPTARLPAALLLGGHFLLFVVAFHHRFNCLCPPGTLSRIVN
jgi:MoxR-like ATPase